VQVRVDADGAGVQPGLMCEGAGPDVGLPGERGDIGDLADGMGDPGDLPQTGATESTYVALEFEIGHYGEDVGVASAFAVAVDATLYVLRSRGDGGHGVGHGAAGIVMSVDAQGAAGAGGDLGDDLVHPFRKHAPVGIAQGDDVGSGLHRGGHRAQGVVGVVAVAVEDVLGVQDHAAALVTQVADGVGDHRQVLLPAGAQGAFHVPDVTLGHECDDRGLGVDQGAYLVVV